MNYDIAFLESANCKKQWTPSKTVKFIYFKRGIPYLNILWREKRLMYNLSENLLTRCRRLKKIKSGGVNVIPPDELELQMAVIRKLGNLSSRQPEPKS